MADANLSPDPRTQLWLAGKPYNFPIFHFLNVKISKEKSEDLVNFFELLEEDDDVQNVYSNAEFSG